MKLYSSSATSPEDCETLLDKGAHLDRRSHPTGFNLAHVVLLYASNVVLLFLYIQQRMILSSSSFSSPQLFYCKWCSNLNIPASNNRSAPLNDIIRYEPQIFHDNVHDQSEFQGPPNDARDAMWDALYASMHYHRYPQLHPTQLTHYRYELNSSNSSRSQTNAQQDNGAPWYQW